MEHLNNEKLRFHVQKVTAINDSGGHFPTREDNGVLIAPDVLLDMPEMLASTHTMCFLLSNHYPTSIDMVRSLANDTTVAIVYTEDLANHLISEAKKLDNAPYMSKHGQVMDLIMRYGASMSEGNE